MSEYYGFVVTNAGYELITKLVAGQKLNLSKVMVGTGSIPEGTDPKTITDLFEPVAKGTSTVPSYDGTTMRMIVEYRSDLNGGLDHGIWLREFGVYAFDPDKGEVLIYYGTLGDRPQYVSAASDSGIDVRRFPVGLIIGEGTGVSVDYKCEAWMTAEDVENYCTVTILPMFLEEAKKLIAAHNEDEAAHQFIQNKMTDLDARLALLELMYGTEVSGNPFTVTFGDLDGVTVEGVWNQSAMRIEF